MSEGDWGRWGKVVPPGGGQAFWLPQPAGGHVTIALSPETMPYDGFSCGTQVLPPGGEVREHGHRRNHELIHVVAGDGVCRIEDEEHALSPGATMLFGRDCRHWIANTGDADMVLFWVFLPPGLEDWFAAIGRPRAPGEPPPAPFDRPADVADHMARQRFVAPRLR
jgi:quercetin dioxygenase-like cupin family protein